MVTRSTILSATLVAFIGCAARASAQPAKPPSARPSVTSIEAYAKQIDRFVKQNDKRKRVFANVGEQGDNWQEFTAKVASGETEPGNFDQVALVWTRGGKVVAAGFTFQTASGDWAHFITYYFRDDGTLAKVHARLNTFYGSVTAIRDKYYGANGKLLRANERLLDIQSQKPKKNPNFHDEPIPTYLTVRALPFSKLL